MNGTRPIGEWIPKRLHRTKSRLDAIVSRRSDPVKKGKPPTRRLNARRRTRKAKKLLGKPVGYHKRMGSKIDSNSLGSSGNAIVLLSRQEFHKKSLTMRRFGDESIPYRETSTFGNNGNETLYQHGIDEHGPYVELYGIEPVDTLVVESSQSGHPTGAGDALMYVPTNPMFVPGSRPFIERGLFDRYQLIESEIHYVPQVPVTQNGSIIMTPTSDPADSFIHDDSRQAILRATGYAGARMFNVVSGDRTGLRLSVDEDPLYTQGGSEDRLESAGFFEITSATTFESPTPGMTQITLGWILLKYRIKFYNPVTPLVAAPFVNEVHTIVPIPWATVWNPLVAEDYIVAGQRLYWLPNDLIDGYWSIIILDDWTDGLGAVLKFESETIDSFNAERGQIIFMYPDDELDFQSVYFAASPSDALSKNNPLRWSKAPDTTLNAAGVYRRMFFSTTQNL